MTDQRPAIAVLTQITGASYGYWNQPTLVLPAAYCIELQRAGAIALALSPDTYLVDHPDELLDRVDGLILSGGGDIPNGDHVPGYTQVNLSAAHEFKMAGGPLTLRADVINVFDEEYEIRDGTGVGVGAPQFGPRRGFYAGVTKAF